MADNKKSVLLYCDIIHTVKELTNEEAGLLFKHYLSYINDEHPEPPNKLIQIVFEPIKQNLKRDLKKWEQKSNKNSEIAKEGWIKRKSANASESIKQNAKNAVKDNAKVTDTVKATKSIEQRKIEFSSSLNPYLEKYTPEFGLNGAKEMLNKFYVYWSEHNPDGKKMFWEMKKTWDLAARIRTWANNQRNFSKNKGQTENKFQQIITSTSAAHDHIKAKHESTGS